MQEKRKAGANVRPGLADPVVELRLDAAPTADQ
jgi:hypothetical protein